QHPAPPHQRLAAHEALERLEVDLSLARQMHHRERDHLATEFLLIQEGAVAADIACLLEGTDAAQARRGRNADPSRQFHIRHAAVFLELAQNMAIDGVEASHRWRLRNGRQSKAAPEAPIKNRPERNL